VKQAYKYWPKTERLETAIHHLNTEGGEGLVDINARPEGLVDVSPVIAAALRTTTDADALKFWRENNAAFAKQPADHGKLKEAIAGHRARMKAAQEAADTERTIEMEPQALTPEELDEQRTAGAPA
jgi:recombination protein RecT